MHLRNVMIFCDVVARRSFSKAALAHHVSQSSASQAVNLLEKRLGSQLIDRSKRPLELTPAGKVYFEGCRDLLASFQCVEERVQQLSKKNAVIGCVRIAAIYSVGLSQMDFYARGYRELYPEAELRLEYLHPDEVYAHVLGDEADIGLVSFPRDGGEFSCTPWEEQRMVLVVPPQHRLAGLDSVSVAELGGESYVGFTPELTVRKKIDRWLKKSKVSVEIVHEFDNIEHIKRAVEIGAGVAILPQPTVHRETENNSLTVVRLEGETWYRPLGIVSRRHKTLSSAAEKFVELLLDKPEGTASKSKTANDSHPAQGSSKDLDAKKKRRKTGSRSLSEATPGTGGG